MKAVLKYLVEEGLVTPKKAKNKKLIFSGYSEYFDVTNEQDDLIDKDFLNEDQQN